MTITNIKPFINSSLNTFYGKLKASRIAAELKTLHQASQKSTIIKSFLAIATLASAVALVALFNASIFFLGLGLGILILAAYNLYHCLHQYKHTTHLFKTATKALTQI